MKQMTLFKSSLLGAVPASSLLKSLALCAALGGAVGLNAQTVTFDPSTYSDAFTYMSWVPTANTLANYPGGGGNGAGGWSLAALPAVISGSQLTLSPNVNTYAAGNTYWTNPDGSGANQMTGSVYTETTGMFVNTSLTLTYNVTANTLAAGYTAYAFISDFGPGYAFNGQSLQALTPGVGSVNFALTGNNPGEIVQYGFLLVGPNANPATVAGLGSVTITPEAVPEPSTIALAGMGGLAALSFIRRRRNQ
jgi:hypothetical protein